MLRGETFNILLVEDSPSDAGLLQEVFKYSRLATRFHVLTDGQKAMEFLYHCGEFAEGPRPDLILLDLTLPVFGGFEVLRAIKADEKLQSIPVIIVTASAIEEDILQAAELRASLYLTKPIDSDGYVDLVKNIEKFWLNYASRAHVVQSVSSYSS